MNVINRAFQSVSKSVQEFLEQEPRAKFTKIMKAAAVAISSSAFYQNQGLMDFFGLQGLAFLMAGSASFIENPEELIQRINLVGAYTQILSHTI